ncbi:NAD(P)/FAD-dependent oxidoreductase [Roseibium algae]|uniref:FAD/NAD(P)-binding oxidoreductase n=1 Tax=Roseibium algae TaxID=3123038 RepID=A0ABU8TN65_9HYPH
MTQETQTVVIIGAGQAGLSVCAKLRSLGHTGPITLIGAEDTPPYQRPPLSKAYALGDMEMDRLLLRPLDFYQANNITLKTSTHVTGIDRVSKTVKTAAGKTFEYDSLVLATGAPPRKLPASIGGDLEGVYCIRTLEDADGFAEHLETSKSALIVGGGYIGLEAAAVAAKRGLKVTLIEAADRILGRVASPQTADYFRALHKAHGVEILEQTGLAKLTGENGQVTGADLSNGAHLAADFVIVGIGVIPEASLAEAAGLTLENGISVDDHCRTNDPSIYAAGDCASFPTSKGRIRLESVGNAIAQADAAAAAILGSDAPYVAKPWFWSDQYDVKLQIAGLNSGYDRVVTRQNDEKSCSFWYFKGDILLAVDAMNDPRAYMIGKRMIENGQSPIDSEIGNPEQNLKTLTVSPNGGMSKS